MAALNNCSLVSVDIRFLSLIRTPTRWLLFLCCPSHQFGYRENDLRYGALPPKGNGPCNSSRGRADHGQEGGELAAGRNIIQHPKWLSCKVESGGHRCHKQGFLSFLSVLSSAARNRFFKVTLRCHTLLILYNCIKGITLASA